MWTRATPRVPCCGKKTFRRPGARRPFQTTMRVAAVLRRVTRPKLRRPAVSDIGKKSSSVRKKSPWRAILRFRYNSSREEDPIPAGRIEISLHSA
jgi:hypothetical protein